MKRVGWLRIAFGVAVLILSQAAQAHFVSARGGGFDAGFAHPFTGPDHLFAMVAVGLWAAQLGGRARWIVPLAFMGAMCVGAGLALAGVGLPMVETGIATSVVALGLLVALSARLSVVTSSILVAAFAVFHGHSHGTELPQAASEVLYSLGFLLATGTLHAIGVGLGALLGRNRSTVWMRAIGAVIAGAGALMMVFV